jgi:hypothetical protein
MRFATSLLRLFVNQIGHVRASHERSGKHRFETEPFAVAPIFVEDVGVHIFSDRKVFASRLKVLAYRDDIDFVAPEVFQKMLDFRVAFTKSDHESRFCKNAA